MSTTEKQEASQPIDGSKLTTWISGLLPLVLLGGLVWLFVVIGPLGVFQAAFPPEEALSIQRIALPEPGLIEIEVLNGGADAVTVAQVIVDEAYWNHSIEPGRTIGRLGRATITVPYPWVEGEAHEVLLLTSTGTTFAGEIAIATQSPSVNGVFLRTFTLLGVYVGVIPVIIGLLWFPFLRAISRQWVNFFLAFTIGLLVFLGVDAVEEALELASEQVAGAFQGVSLILVGALGTFLILDGFARWSRERSRDKATAHLVLAYLIALGIGLHNLGEGLAIGAAYAVGEVALGAFLVIGFMIHNTTEGLAIVSPIAKGKRPAIEHLIAMGLLAGAPTIVGAWIGGFTFSPVFSTLFLAIGAGAIFQVVYAIGKMMVREAQEGEAATSLLNVAGLIAGLLVMYATGLLVTG